MTDAPIRVEVVCEACGGTGETEGYPGYAPQGGPDGARYSCWGCKGEKHYAGTAPKGSLTEAMMQLAEAYLAFRGADRSLYASAEVQDETLRLARALDAATARVGERVAARCS